MNKKKILVIASTFPRWKNDFVPYYVYDLSEKLSKDFEIVVLCPHYPGTRRFEKIGDVKVYRFVYFWPYRYEKLCYEAGILQNVKKSMLLKLQVPFLFLAEYFSLKKIIKKEKPDILHAHWLIPQGFISSKFKMPLITTIHGSDITILKNALSKFMQRKAICNSDFITVNSNMTKKILLDKFPEAEKKTKVIPMGVDIAKFYKKYSKRNDIILFVGRLTSQKGVQYLLKAMPLILDKNPKTKLLVVGGGEFKKDLIKLASDLNIGKNVEFLGGVSKEKVADYYNLAKICILPSIDVEGLGVTLIEALASGTAVIGTNVGGIPEVIIDNKTGLLVKQKDSKDLAEKILKLLSDDKLRNKLTANGQKHIQKFSWEVIRGKFRELYENTAL